MKKIIAMLVTFCLILSAGSAMFTAGALTDGDFTYSLINDDTEVSIDRYNGSATDITVPEIIDGKPVTVIGSSAFMFLKVQNVVLPDTVTEICSNAFNGCDKLETIKLPQGLKKIKNEAFQGCNVLKEVNFPNGLENIFNKAFFGCNSIETVYIPSSVVSVGAEAFAECDNLVEVRIAEGVKSIQSDAFSWNIPKVYRRIFVPESVSEIYSRSIYGATAYLYSDCYAATVLSESDTCYLDKLGDIDGDSLKTVSDVILLRKCLMGDAYVNRGGIICDIDIDGKVTVSDVVELRKMIMNPIETVKDGLVYRIENNSATVIKCVGSSENVIIPATVDNYPVTAIGASAFKKSAVSTVTIPDSVTYIGNNAFEQSNITEITIPDSVGEIAHDTFFGCKYLTRVVLPDGMTILSARAFYCCTALKTINIPAGVKKLGYMTFNSSGLEEITIPSTMEGLGALVFEDCKNLKTVTIENGLKDAGEFTFMGCESLEEIIFPETLETIGAHALSNCPKLKKAVFPQGTTFSRNPVGDVPDQEGYNNIFAFSPLVTVYGYAGSDAEVYTTERDMPFVAIENVVEITPANFPDEVFIEDVRKFDLNNDGWLSNVEIEKVEEIDVGVSDVVIQVYPTPPVRPRISSLKGVEYFTSLKSLECYNNNLTELDVSNNLELEYLNCKNNKLTELDLTSNVALKKLYCDDSVTVIGWDK